MKTLYHYTSKSNYDSIIDSGTIKSTDPWTTTDAAYGHGWYMTDIEPKTCDMAIALNCWKDKDALEKVEYYLQFEVEDSHYALCRKNVYIITEWNSKKIKYIKGEKIPYCSKRPCEKCDTGLDLLKKNV